MKTLLTVMARCGKLLDPTDERDYKVEVPGVVELKLPVFGTVVVFLTMLAEMGRYLYQYPQRPSYCNHIEMGLL